MEHKVNSRMADLDEILDCLEDIAGQMRVHLQASPLDDIIENSLEDLELLIERLGEEV